MPTLNFILILLITFQTSVGHANRCVDIFKRLVPNRVEAEITPSEIEVVKLLDSVALEKSDVTREVDIWIDQMTQKVDQSQGTIIDYAGLSYVYKTGFFRTLENNSEIQIKNLLSQLRSQLTGRTTTDGQVAQRLPRRLARSLNPRLQVFYNACFREVPTSSNIPHSYREVLASYIPTRGDLGLALSGVVMSATVFHQLGAKYLAAAFMGAAITSIAEHIFHGYGAHAPKSLTESRVVGKFFRGMQYNHTVIHHGVTYRDNYMVQFKDEAHQQQVQDLITKHKGPDFLDKMTDNRFGLTLNVREYLGILWPIASFTGALSYFLGFDIYQTSLTILPTLAYPAGVNLTHEYMHLTRQEIIGMTQDKPLIRRFLRTRYAALMAQVHYVHHDNYNTNYNLLFLFADVLFQRMRLPSLKEIAEMRELEGLGTDWGPQSLER